MSREVQRGWCGGGEGYKVQVCVGQTHYVYTLSRVT